MSAVAEIIATIVTLLFILIGVGAQIKFNWKRKSVQGLSLTFSILAMLVPASWAWFGFLSGAVIMGAIQALGAVVASIIIYQFWLYRNNGGPPSPLPPTKNGDDNTLNRWSDEGGR